MAGDSYPDTSGLQRQAKRLLEKFARVEASGDTGALEAVRHEMRACHAQLQPIFDGMKAVEMIKSAHRRPQSLFAASPGAAVLRK